MIDNLTEQELIEGARAGDQDCFSFLIRKNMLTVRKIARKFFLLGAEEEDLVQEGMIGLANAINTFDEKKDASFKTFSTLCIKRSVLSAIKKSTTKKEKAFNDSISLDGQGGFGFLKNVDEDEDFVFVVPAQKMQPDDIVIWKERLEEIKQFVFKTLSNYEKLVLSEFLKGKSYAQISDVVKKPTSSVENALSRIRTKLSPLKKQ